MNHKQFKRILSAVLCVALLLPCFLCGSFKANAAAEGTQAVTSTEIFTEGGVDYTIDRTTQYIGNRTYRVQMDISADLSSLEHTRVRTATHNGYVTIQETGYYMLEAWGGRGGDGGDNGLLQGGDGGSSGHVYGKVFLKAGQVLVYNIGTNGIQSTVHDDGTGGYGGEEGDLGGTHGDVGSRTVGAGGGYTAIYLFEEGEFDPSYVSETSFKIPETARLNRYLMIAGGGGGGGAAPTGDPIMLILNGTVTEPDGGNGGDVDRGVSMALTGNNYDVPGYVFSGRNGSSSGTSTEYVGHGGTNVPGRIPSTLMGSYSQTELPNDWTGTSNPAVLPGAGGSGNLRGGGGGSGYAGGSGGLMEALTLAIHVGGGGGGSSFIAQQANGKEIQFTNLGEDGNYISNTQPDNTGPGGAVQITFLSSAESPFYEETLSDIVLTGEISRYFDVLSSSKTTGSDLVTTVNADNTTSFTAGGLHITPASPAASAKTASVTLFLRAKDAFFGGNSVEMISKVQADFLSPNDKTTPITLALEEQIRHSTVNVPLNAKIRTNSYTTSNKEKTYNVTDLYEADYAGYISAPSENWECDYITSISAYEVYLGDTKKTGTVKPPQTLGADTYEVRLTFEFKTAADPAVKVGPSLDQQTTVTGNAVITLVEADTAELNGLTVTGTKSLTYADGIYTFSTTIDQTSDELPVVGEPYVIGPNDDSAWQAPAEGWYLVEAWGGNGGSGGRATLTWGYYYSNWGTSTWTSGSDYINGGSGGTGGKVRSYVYLQKDEYLYIEIGAAGETGAGGTANASTDTQRYATYSSGGSGGQPTNVRLEDNATVLIGAGGGGGGGGSGYAAKTKEYSAGLESEDYTRGTAGNDSTTINNTGSATAGGSGGVGSASWSQGIFGIWSKSSSGGRAGTAGVSYKNPNFGITQDGHTLSTAAQIYADSIDTKKTGTTGAGEVAITLIETDEMISTMETVKGIETQVAFSQYFDVNSIELDAGTAYDSKADTPNDDGSITVTYTSNTYGQIAQFTYKIETAPDGISKLVTITDCDYALTSQYTPTAEGYSMHYTAHLEFSYALTPREGFLGGNDVPILAYGQYDGENMGQTGGVADKDSQKDCSVRISQGADFMNLQPVGPTDFANVAHTVDFESMLTVRDKTIRLGDSVNKTELYTFTPTVCAEDWQDDFVYFISPGEDLYTPDKTTDYTITAGFAPVTEVAQKATVVESVQAQAYSLVSTVYVEVPVTYNLTNMGTDGADWTMYNESFGCTLKPNSGYELPENILVTVGGTEITNYTYSSSVGSIMIPAEAVTGPIAITAQAAVKTYEVHIVYTTYDETTGSDVLQDEVVIENIQADQPIDWSALEAIKPTIPAKPGHNYEWTFDTPDEQQPELMPANDLWVYGSYVKAQYPLKINYVYEDGTQAAEPYDGVVTFGEDYVVTSPSIKGYMPDQIQVIGTMGTGEVTVTVTYTPSANQLLILHLKPDGTELGRVTETLSTDAPYSYESPAYPGYTPDTPVVSGTMTGDQSETVIVYYTPNKYTLNFVYKENGFDAATMDQPDTKLVEYDNIYGYNAGENEDGVVGTYDGLPTPQYPGYVFGGWYLDREFTEDAEVTESDTVLITADTEVYGKWERESFKLTIRYQYLYEDGDFVAPEYATTDLKDKVVEVPYGDTYSIDLPAFTGYSAYTDFGLNDQQKLTTLTGTMPGQNRLVVITYQINTYHIRFMDKPGEQVTYSDAATSNVDTDSFDVQWGEVAVKHNVVPEVPVTAEDWRTPNHDTRAEYTYQFTGWYGTNDGESYEGETPVFPAATSERDYYAMYTATENIVQVSYGSTNKYFTTVAAALECAETNIVSEPTMTFRRNDGNETVVNLNNDTLIFGNTYTGTGVYPITVDLNSLKLENTIGQSAVENKQSYINVVIQDDGTGSIQVSGDGDVVAVDTDTRNLTVNQYALIKATSTNGNATAVRAGGGTAAFSSGSMISAVATNGTATGIAVTKSAAVTASQISVSGSDVVGIRVDDGVSATLNAANMELSATADASAVGIHVLSGGTLKQEDVPANTQTVTSAGTAMGVQNDGTVTALNLKMDVQAQGDAYGLYNNAGTVTVGGIGSKTDLRAVSESGSGYGLYNVADGAPIGAADGEMLKSGAFAGSTSGIYSADSSIFASGNDLYFKGADPDSALDGVVYDDAYDEVDATDQFEAGYYRLAQQYTITFETNGGTEVASVTKYYGESLTDVVPVTTRLGYDFASWHRMDDLSDQAYTLPATMPGEDFTMYAKWTLLQYKYALDTSFKEYTVRFHKNMPTDDGLFGEVKVTEDNPILTVPVEDPTYQSGSTLYIFNGWYSQPTDTAATYVTLNGDLAELDPDEDGIIDLYAGWESMGSNAASVAFDTTASSAYVTNSHTSSNLYRMYFVVPVDGDYSVSVGSVGAGATTSYRKDLRIYTYKHGTKSSEFINTYTNYKTSLTYVNYASSNYSGLRGLKAGDVIIVQLYRTSSTSGYESTVYSKISATPAEYSNVENYYAYSDIGTEVLFYDVEQGENGVVVLPEPEEREGYSFIGWADVKENAAPEDMVTQLTPEMTETVEPWQNGELWQLYSQWKEKYWNVYTSAGRNFTAFETTGAVSVRSNDSVSVRFKALHPVEEAVSFQFANALPAGTLLTLVDRSNGYNQYYSYQVTTSITELSSEAFQAMGLSDQFGGIGTDLTLQICYANAANPTAANTVSIRVGEDAETVEKASYSLIAASVTEKSLGTSTFVYTATHTATLTVPALTAQGFGGSDKVFLRIRWDDLNIAPGAVFTAGGNTVQVYDGEYAVAELGTVSQYDAESSLAVSVYLPTMVQNEFTGKTFRYELCVIPAQVPTDKTVFGDPVEPVLQATEVLSLAQTPSISVSGNSAGIVSPGGEAVIEEIAPAGVTLYLYQQADSGEMVPTQDCMTVLASMTVQDNGQILAADGSTPVIDGTFRATISANATSGTYFIKIVSGDKYELVRLRIAATE